MNICLCSLYIISHICLLMSHIISMSRITLMGILSLASPVSLSHHILSLASVSRRSGLPTTRVHRAATLPRAFCWHYHYHLLRTPVVFRCLLVGRRCVDALAGSYLSPCATCLHLPWDNAAHHSCVPTRLPQRTCRIFACWCGL